MHRYIFAILLIAISSCSNSKTVREHRQVSEILWAVMQDNPEDFKADCKLLTSLGGELQGPSHLYHLDSNLAYSLSTYLTEDEITYLLEQKQERKGLVLESDMFSQAFELVDINEIKTLQASVDASKATDNQLDYWDEFEKKYGCIMSLSLPLISKDNNMVLVRSSRLCGPLCGGSSIVLYKLKDGRWQLEEILDVEIN